ncbi:heterokaryon incompatibility protein-domain-containing protein [Lasiosphaeris hirsuta]|uniref:Heterokaryon incompatibility protein-domain-containing protein n=1 Tax=Lasiosphaeris hirsuta TaxID=260670 RepID=A0AA40BD91_9PEZI|nr:heterokaryon incompatibility protein-domain-containing protein [Lasiosphaeris hirsuta]
MRLINVSTLGIEEFYGSSVPEYAILSHTWADVEASFQEWTKRLTRLRKMKRPGFSKVLAACKQARRDGLAYLWADTVCIDKSSSSELSEAINSMYGWYERAAICYVYLSDVPDHPRDKIDTLDLVRKSRWFKRGWTLQELLAPAHIVFYSREWSPLGTKNALAVLISSVTKIDEVCLNKRKRLEEYSIAQRMAWAADRVTTRQEDIAYCLLGIFSINMPLLYGEGLKAFKRLQEEIIKVLDDQSILAFDTHLSDGTLFAHHPCVFAKSSRIHPNFALKLTAPFSTTNAGLTITTPLVQTLSPYWTFAVLNCVEVETQRDMRRSLIYLPLFGKDGRFMRARMPVSLICKVLDESSSDRLFGVGIQDLAAQAESSYIISYFNRIYSIYGTEMDLAMKGFEVETGSHAGGFMLAFPRGMSGYQVCTAYPREDIRPEISFFIPTASLVHATAFTKAADLTATPAEAKRLVLFKKEGPGPTSYVGLYLAASWSSGAWTCKLVTVPGEFDHRWQEAEDLIAAADEEALGIGHEKPWMRYDHLGNAIVEAHTKFKTLTGVPCINAVMVEIVFDVDVLLQERDM